MKTNLKFALCALVIAFSIAGCCDCKNDKQEKAPSFEKLDYVTGVIKMVDQKIKVHIDARVASKTFQVQNYQIINFMEYKAIALRYQNTVNPGDLQDDGIDEVMSYDLVIDETSVDQDDDKVEWKMGDKVRIMLVNDDQINVLSDLKNYFYSRMIYYANNSIDAEELNRFNTGWNKNNRNLQIRSFTANKKPRLAKGDVILGIQ